MNAVHTGGRARAEDALKRELWWWVVGLALDLSIYGRLLVFVIRIVSISESVAVVRIRRGRGSPSRKSRGTCIVVGQAGGKRLLFCCQWGFQASVVKYHGVATWNDRRQPISVLIK